MNSPMILFLFSSLSVLVLFFFYKKRFLDFGVVFCSISFFSISICCSFYASTETFTIGGGGLPDMYVGSIIAMPVGRLFALSALLVAIGGLVGRVLLDVLGRRKVPLNRSDLSSFVESFSSKIGFEICGLVFYLFYFGQILPELISRDTYLFIEPGSLVGSLRYVSPLIGFLSLGFMRNRFTFLLLILYFLSFFNEFALNSRNAPALMAGFVILCYLRLEGRFAKYIILFFGFLSTYFFFLYLMFSRLNMNYGVLALFSQFPSFIENVTSQSLPSTVSTVFGNFLSIIPVTYLGLQIPTPDSYLSISFNPLFGKDVGWYDIGYLFYVNPWTPSGSVAQVAGLNSVSVILTWLLVGLLFQINGNLMLRFSKNVYLRILSFALPIFATLQFLQYTLRSGLRYVYLWLFIGLLANCLKNLSVSFVRNNP